MVVEGAEGGCVPASKEVNKRTALLQLHSVARFSMRLTVLHCYTEKRGERVSE